MEYGEKSITLMTLMPSKNSFNAPVLASRALAHSISQPE